MTWPFIPNKLYNRRAEIHGRYGGQMQGGIATPAAYPAVFLFTGHGASKIGYGDAEQTDGSFRYTGEGQVGDMQMIRGNLAIRDHAIHGRDLLLFEKSVSRGPVRYVGQFFCAGWESEQQPDVNGNLREAIVFTLVPIERVSLSWSHTTFVASVMADQTIRGTWRGFAQTVTGGRTTGPMRRS